MATRCLSSLPLLSPSSSRKACTVVRTHPANPVAAHRRIRTHMSVATGGEQALTAEEQFQEPDYGVVSIHHVGILCENLERSIAFYQDILGLKVNLARPNDKLPYRGAWLWVGSEMIHLMELPNPDPLTGRPEHGGRDRHTCIAIKDVLKLKEIFDKAERSTKTKKLQPSPSASRQRRHHEAVGGAPSQLLPSSPWNRSRPPANGKSPIAGPEGPTLEAAVVDEPSNITFFENFTRRIRRPRSGLGKARTATPRSCEHRGSGRSTAELRRTPSSKGMSAATSRCTSRATASEAPPAENLTNPTLCTHRDPAFPHPPAAGAAGGGGGTTGSAAARWVGWAGFRKSPSTVDEGEGTVQGCVADFLGISYTLSKSGRPAIFARDPDGNALEFTQV